MNILHYPERKDWPELLRRPELNQELLEEQVQRIIREVAEHGDSALKKYTREFDGWEGESMEVSADEFSASGQEVGRGLKEAIEEARRNIHAFHQKQIHAQAAVVTTAGVRCWQKPVPIRKVGLYVPGGSAPLLSTVLMLGIPARLAGCQEVVLCTPPNAQGKVSPSILYIASLLGIHRVFKVGGAQAIAAMAHGTDRIPKVDKIFGPGNQYVTMAKQIVSRDTVAIDMPAGPSELAVLADAGSHPAFVASDLLSQAEHGPDSQVLLITDSTVLIDGVKAEVEKQLELLPRKQIAAKALENSKIILLKNQEEMMALVNEYAPEHLIIATRNYAQLSGQVVNAGSVFLGDYTPESAGDYVSGTNHTLPTKGWAHAYSGVNMDSFTKKITFQEISRYGLHNIGAAIMTMAEAENLQAHSNAVSIRLDYREDERAL